MTDKKDIKKVLDFWFKETTPKQKFAKDPRFDAKVKRKFEALYWKVMKGKTASWRTTPQGRLAEIVILDQFSRNMFRDTKQGFAGDKLALKLARQAVRVGADAKLSKKRRMFMYMPYMHSESRVVHKEALKIFKASGSAVMFGYEKKHKTIIDRFGRYPHRNNVLGRKSTAKEKEFLKEHTGF